MQLFKLLSQSCFPPFYALGDQIGWKKKNRTKAEDEILEMVPSFDLCVAPVAAPFICLRGCFIDGISPLLALVGIPGIPWPG